MGSLGEEPKSHKGIDQDVLRGDKHGKVDV